MKNNFAKIFLSVLLAAPLAGCLGSLKTLKVLDFTDQRVGDLAITKKVTGKRDFLFFSTTKMTIFLDGNVQGVITDYQGNPIEGVTVKVQADSGKSKTADAGVDEFAATGEGAKSSLNLYFSPGISDSMGLYNIHFSLPVTDDEVDVRGKLVYNPGWEQQRLNLGKAYEPQMKTSPFRLYYNLDTGFLAFGEGVRSTVVQPVGEGKGRMQNLPGAAAPEPLKPAASGNMPGIGPNPEEDLFKGFDFGQ